MEGPGDGFVPGAGGRMEGNGSEGFFEHAVVAGGVLEVVLGEVEVVVDVEIAEVGAGQEGVPFSDEVGADGEGRVFLRHEASLSWNGLGVTHAVGRKEGSRGKGTEQEGWAGVSGGG